MKIEKIVLDDIERCYAVSGIVLDEKLNLLYASENPESICNRYYGNDFSQKEKVWNDRGGCMSIVQIPDKKNEIVAVNEFYLKANPSLSKLVRGKYDNQNGWIFKDIFNHPYIHRFAINNVGGVNYISCATISEYKENKEDWSTAGCIYTGILPDDFDKPLEMKPIVTGCFRNHGCCYSDGCTYYSSDQGIYRITPKKGDWKIEHIMDGNISDLAIIDIDNDGNDEIMTIEPFHGNIIRIYKMINDKYQPVYTYSNKIDFAHCLVGTKILSANCFIAGVRREQAELFMVQYKNGKFVETIIDSGVGPANIQVIHMDEYDMIASANHTKNQAVIYKIFEHSAN